MYVLVTFEKKNILVYYGVFSTYKIFYFYTNNCLLTYKYSEEATIVGEMYKYTLCRYFLNLVTVIC